MAVGGVLDGAQAHRAAFRGDVEDAVAAVRAVAEVNVGVVAQDRVDLGLGTPASVIEVAQNSVAIVGASGSPKSRLRSHTNAAWASPLSTTQLPSPFAVIVSNSRSRAAG